MCNRPTLYHYTSPAPHSPSKTFTSAKEAAIYTIAAQAEWLYRGRVQMLVDTPGEVLEMRAGRTEMEWAEKKGLGPFGR